MPLPSPAAANFLAGILCHTGTPYPTSELEFTEVKQ